MDYRKRIDWVNEFILDLEPTDTRVAREVLEVFLSHFSMKEKWEDPKLHALDEMYDQLKHHWNALYSYQIGEKMRKIELLNH